MPEKNKFYETEITGLNSDGAGVCRVENMAVFVPDTAVGDKIRVKIVKVLKNYAYGIVDEISVPSADRQERPCKVCKKCGGCVYRHISYSAECRAKDDIIKNAFRRIGGLNPVFEEFIPAENPEHYRNKIILPFGRNENGLAECGFFAPRSHRIIPMDSCSLQPCIFDNIINYIKNSPQMYGIKIYNEKTRTGWLRNLYIRQGFHSGEIMVCFVVTTEKTDPHFRNMVRGLVDEFTDIKSVVLNINPDDTNVVLGKKCVTLFGSDTIEDTMCGNRIQISPLSFYQVNTAQAEKLYGKALEYASPDRNDTVADLYCGTGTIGLSMASHVKKVIGVEIVPEAVENACKNAKLNNISNAEFYTGDAKDLPDNADIVVLDPPRKGCSEETLISVRNINPKKIVMISCNPATASRDAKWLSQNGYTVEKVCGVDLFPSTKHVECVVLMSRNDS